MKHKSRFRTFWNKAASTVGITAMLFINMGNLQPVAHAQSNLQDENFSTEISCLNAASFLAGGSEERILNRPLNGQQDWVKFDTQQGKRYQITANASGQRVQLLIQDGCQGDSQLLPVKDGKILFTAQKNATYYVNVSIDGITRSSLSNSSLNMTQLPASPASNLPLSDVPVEIQRRAADRLEEMRGSPDMPEWDNAQLANDVRPIYRPDMAEPAYYEFLVEKPGQLGLEPAGFIEVSTGEFDHPVPNWGHTGLSPTQAMEDLAPTGGATISKYYKVDVLSFVAEYEQSTPLGLSVAAEEPILLGQLPPKYTGFESLPLGFEPSTTDYVWKPASTGGEDGQSSEITPTLEITGPDEPFVLSQEPWDSWEALKSEYAETNAVLLDNLKEEAQPDWAYEKELSQFGEPLLKDESRSVHALSTLSVTSISLVGEGSDSQFLLQEPLMQNGIQTGVRFTVTAESSEANKELPFTVTIQYSSGVSETKHFTIINQSFLQPPNNVYLPLVSSGGSQQNLALANQVSASSVDAPLEVQWGPWSTWWAAGTWQGNSWPYYNQIPPNTRVNGTNCYSGCTNTAYAMLFAWADRRAAIPGSIWNGRWGIYRQNGGTGSDAVAPEWEFQDRGIENVMMELNRHMGTFCQDKGGATYISRQPDAQRYLTPRTGATIRVREANGWWIFGTNEDDTRNQTINAIKGGSPVVITTPGHSPMAHGYRERSQRIRHCFIFCWYTTSYDQEFYINQGWGNYGNQWIKAKTISSGEILRN